MGEVNDRKRKERDLSSNIEGGSDPDGSAKRLRQEEVNDNSNTTGS
jgi:hypothetical protein